MSYFRVTLRNRQVCEDPAITVREPPPANTCRTDALTPWHDRRFLVDTAKLAIELEREPIDPAQNLGDDGKIKRRVRKEEIERKIRKLMQQGGRPDHSTQHATNDTECTESSSVWWVFGQKLRAICQPLAICTSLGPSYAEILINATDRARSPTLPLPLIDLVTSLTPASVGIEALVHAWTCANHKWKRTGHCCLLSSHTRPSACPRIGSYKNFIGPARHPNQLRFAPLTIAIGMAS